MQSCHECQISLLANEEESIYGRTSSGKNRPRTTTGDVGAAWAAAARNSHLTELFARDSEAAESIAATH